MNNLIIVKNATEPWEWLYVNGKLAMGNHTIPVEVIAVHTPIEKLTIRQLDSDEDFLPYSYKNIEEYING